MNTREVVRNDGHLMNEYSLLFYQKILVRRHSANSHFLWPLLGSKETIEIHSYTVEIALEWRS